MVNNAMIVGGTHGNESTGVYSIEKYKQAPHLVKRPSFKTHTLLANPKAVRLGKRYVETDLNRSFAKEVLTNTFAVEYEQLLAKDIASIIQRNQIDFIVDIHSTTSNMGLTIIYDKNPSEENPFIEQLVAYLQSINPSVRILQYLSNTTNNRYLAGQVKNNLTIEVGPIANGVLNAKIFKETDKLIQQILDYIDLNNRGETPPTIEEYTVYQYLTGSDIDYPRDENGDINALIAPEVQDYQPLINGDRLFIGFNDEVITYQGNSVVYPVFVGEAAYIEKGIAMALTKQLHFSFSI